MKSKDKKQEELEQLKRELASATNLVVAQFSGMTVAQDFELRQKIRSTNSKYRVVKNTLARAASEGTPAAAVAKTFEGATSIAYNSTDPVALAKALTAYAKAHPVFVFKAGIVEGRVVPISELANIAALPSREELISQLMFLIKSPAQGLATAINGVARNLAVVIGQAVEQGKFQE